MSDNCHEYMTDLTGARSMQRQVPCQHVGMCTTACVQRRVERSRRAGQVRAARRATRQRAERRRMQELDRYRRGVAHGDDRGTNLQTSIDRRDRSAQARNFARRGYNVRRSPSMGLFDFTNCWSRLMFNTAIMLADSTAESGAGSAPGTDVETDFSGKHYLLIINLLDVK